MLKKLRLVIALVSVGVMGCGSLLPSTARETPSPFGSFEAAKLAIEKVRPYQTTVAELTALGFDIRNSPNVTLIPYPESAARLAPHPGVPLTDLDRGVRDCLTAISACRVYIFHFGDEHNKREGSFWADFLNFRRITHVTGWRFEGLVALSDGVVLFSNYSGDALIQRTDKQTNPLGPLQPAGEAAGRSLIR